MWRHHLHFHRRQAGVRVDECLRSTLRPPRWHFDAPLNCISVLIQVVEPHETIHWEKKMARHCRFCRGMMRRYPNRRICSVLDPMEFIARARALFIMNAGVQQHPVHHQSGCLEPHAFVQAQQQASRCLDAGVCTS